MLGVIAGFFGSLLSSSVVRWIATKVLLTTLFLTVLPAVLKSVLHYVASVAFDKINAVLPSGSFVVQLTGLGAYFANHLRLPEFVSILLSALALKFTLDVIKKFV